jgi:hypothetical protein
VNVRFSRIAAIISALLLVLHFVGCSRPGGVTEVPDSQGISAPRPRPTDMSRSASTEETAPIRFIGTSLTTGEAADGWQPYILELMAENASVRPQVARIVINGTYVETSEGYTYPVEFYKRYDNPPEPGSFQHLSSSFTISRIPPGFRVRGVLEDHSYALYEHTFFASFKVPENMHPTHLVFPEAEAIELDSVQPMTFPTIDVISLGPLPGVIEIPDRIRITIGPLGKKNEEAYRLFVVAPLTFENLNVAQDERVFLDFDLIGDDGLVVENAKFACDTVLAAGPSQKVDSEVCFRITERQANVHYYLFVYASSGWQEGPGAELYLPEGEVFGAFQGD